MENEIMKFEEVMESLSVGKNEQRRDSGVSDRKGLENTEKVSDSVCGGEACGEGLKKAEHFVCSACDR